MAVTNTEWGHYAERVITERHSLTPIEDTDSRAWYADAVVSESSRLPYPEGTLVEVKSCRKLIVNGSGYKPGHWWLEKRATENNAAEDGLAALVVTDPEATHPILRSQIYPMERLIEAWVGEWTSNGAGHHKGDYSTRIEWAEVFQTLRDPMPTWGDQR